MKYLAHIVFATTLVCVLLLLVTAILEPYRSPKAAPVRYYHVSAPLVPVQRADPARTRFDHRLPR